MPTAAERKALSQGLATLNENMATLAELAQLAIRKAVDALARADAKEADEVYTLDHEIFGLQIEVERTCVDLIALHAPVARDLRTITTSLKITTDLDRIGRYAKDIADIAVELQKTPPAAMWDLSRIPRMAELTMGMVDTAIKAFLHRDAPTARTLHQADDTVDALHDEIFRELVAGMVVGSMKIDVGARYILVSRYFERIADHAVNIGERVVYMVTGEWRDRK